MKEITEIFAEGRTPSEIIADLSEKSVVVPDWEELQLQYDLEKHYICTDHVGRKDRLLDDGSLEKAARISVGLEELIANRLNQFTFAIPVKRNYGNIQDNQTRKDIAKAIELIYRKAHIDNENNERGLAYYASCEIFTVWYAVKKDNDLYGFHSSYKLRCKTYSPMNDDVKLYPLIDDLGEMWAMSFSYTKKVKDKHVNFFETYTADRHYLWKQDEASVWTTAVDGEEISIGKIPGTYLWRKKPCFSHTPYLRNEIEYTVSRSSDTIAYNSAPIIKVSGGVKGQEKKGESHRVWRVEKGGDVSYVGWNQANEANSNQVEQMLRFIFMQEQMPDISFDKMKSLGNVGYDARMLMFADPHLRVGQESGPWIEFFERENNVIKAFLKQMNVTWADEIDNVTIDNIITPYIPNDLSTKVKVFMEGSGNKPIMSRLDAIKYIGLSKDPEATLEEIEKQEQEAAEAAANQMNSVFG